MIQFIVDHWEVLCALLLSMPLLGISAGGGASNTDTRFERSGTSTSQQSHVVPSGLAGLLNQLANASSVPAATTTNQYTALNALLNRPTSDVPHKSVLDDNAKASPGTFTGSQVLESLASRDPNSSSFEADTTEAYQRRAGEAMAGMQSGPAAVRGATERVPLAQGQMAVGLAEGRGSEVRGARVQEAGISTGAAQTSSAIEQARRQQAVLAQDRANVTLDQVADSARRQVLEARTRAEATIREIAGQGPDKTLGRGFAVVRAESGATLTGAQAAREAGDLQIEFRDGRLPARVRTAEGKGKT